MKIPSIRPVRSIALDTIFKPSRNKTRRGLNPFKSKLEAISGLNRKDIRPTTYNLATRRIALVRTKGKAKFHAVGFGEFSGSFPAFKIELKRAGYTGIRMFGKVSNLD
jgi:hypothetical protein